MNLPASYPSDVVAHTMSDWKFEAIEEMRKLRNLQAHTSIQEAIFQEAILFDSKEGYTRLSGGVEHQGEFSIYVTTMPYLTSYSRPKSIFDTYKERLEYLSECVQEEENHPGINPESREGF